MTALVQFELLQPPSELHKSPSHHFSQPSAEIVTLSCNYKHRGPQKFINHASSIFIAQKLKTSMSPAKEM